MTESATRRDRETASRKPGAHVPVAAMLPSNSYSVTANTLPDSTEWARLHGQSPNSPFSHPAWFGTWLRHFGEGVEPIFLAIERDGRLVGVVPLERTPDGYRQLGNFKIADYSGLLAASGEEATLALALLEWLEAEGSPPLELWGLPADGPLAQAVNDTARSCGWQATAENEAVCPRASLEGGWDAVLARLAKHDRHELRRKLRNFEALGQVGFEAANDPASVGAGMDSLFAMMRASHERKDRFLTPAIEAFFRDIACTFAGLGIARLCTLTLDGAPAAMLLAFENEAEVFLYNSGYDPALARVAPGFVSKALAMRDAIDRGRATFDFLRGDEDYKFRLGGQPRRLVRLRLSQANSE